jgi:peptidoglycan/LPS O-acetylase OafA/YrhL
MATVDGNGPGEHLGLLTTYRFFAALLVVICHNAIIWETSSVPLLRDLKSNGGKYGVSFFFVLSGFILAHRYMGTEVHGSLPKYFRARFARIVPLYWLCLLLSVGSFWVTSKLTGAGFPSLAILKDVAIKFLFLQSVYAPWNADFHILQQGWTLSVEMLFYACFPFLLRLGSRISERARFSIVGSGILLHMVATYAQWNVTPYESTSFHFLAWSPVVHFPLFFLGMSIRIDTARWAQIFMPLVSKIVSLGIVLLCLFRGLDMHRPLGVLGLLWLIAHIIVSSLSVRKNFLTSASWQFLGNASYGLYLVHGLAAAFTPFVLKKLKLTAELPAYPYFLGSSIIAIVMSCVLFKWFEQPLRKWINSL